MKNPTGFEIAKQAMEVLDFYRTFYASGADYQKHHQEVLAMIRHRAEGFKGGPQYGEYKFLMLFAAALEVSNASGEYVQVPGSSA